MEYTAKFKKAYMADAFADGLPAWSPKITNIKHKRRTGTVVFEAPAELYMDLAESVGYHGSPPQGPVATLNGHPTPRSY
jgi:hypothetical protein